MILLVAFVSFANLNQNIANAQNASNTRTDAPIASQIFLSETAVKRLKPANGAQTENSKLNLADLLKKELVKKGFAVQSASASKTLYDRRGNFKVPTGAKFIDSESVDFSNSFVVTARTDEFGNPVFESTPGLDENLRAIQEKRVKCVFKLIIRESSDSDRIFHAIEFSNEDDASIQTSEQCDAKVRQLILDIPHL